MSNINEKLMKRTMELQSIIVDLCADNSDLQIEINDIMDKNRKLQNENIRLKSILIREGLDYDSKNKYK